MVLLVSFILVCILSQVTAVASGRELKPIDKTTFMVPYDDYVITQGLHGFSYGHMAIDISAGKGAVIKSPIDGEVSANYIDQLGNTTLVIENNLYKVTLLHGKYSVSIGDVIEAGQPIGAESNLGYTTDMQGRPCGEGNCGYHTHMNVYNKKLSTNVSPLDLIDK
jgi:murein DD-endopeptidase MepM/ murein hydrolase activator NlpD